MKTKIKGARKRIRKIINDSELGVLTKIAAEKEDARKLRIQNRDSKSTEIFGDFDGKSLVLDFDFESKKPLVSVNSNLASKLKPHRAKGVKFLWDACFESCEKLATDEGSGCILAHCMGLGTLTSIFYFQ